MDKASVALLICGFKLYMVLTFFNVKNEYFKCFIPKLMQVRVLTPPKCKENEQILHIGEFFFFQQRTKLSKQTHADFLREIQRPKIVISGSLKLTENHRMAF